MSTRGKKGGNGGVGVGGGSIEELLDRAIDHRED